MNPPRTLKLTIQYDGTDFVGWQRQASGTSVQGLIEEALAAFEGGPVALHGAGRTDAGVHALGQVASVSLTAAHAARAIHRGLNAVLPPAVRIVSVEEAAPGFHARYNALSKVYDYHIVNAPVMPPFQVRYAWHVPQPIDLSAMRRAADLFVGEHDFAAFQGQGSAITDTVRTIASIGWSGGASGEVPLVVTVTADGFLRHMVRTVVGTLVDVGGGRWPPETISAMLASRLRAAAGRTAPAHGLFLVRVCY